VAFYLIRISDNRYRCQNICCIFRRYGILQNLSFISTACARLYPLDLDIEKQMAGLVQVINKSSSDDLMEEDITIEVRLKDLYLLNNYIQSIQHLPSVIEIDALDSRF
jgi:hypothetical protein